MELPEEAMEMNGSENQRLRREEILRIDLENAQLKWEMIEVDIQEKEDKIWAVKETNWKDRKAAERAQRERIESEARKAIEEENAAHEKERAVLAAFKQAEADNKMCSCPFASFSPHRHGKCVGRAIGKGMIGGLSTEESKNNEETIQKAAADRALEDVEKAANALREAEKDAAEWQTMLNERNGRLRREKVLRVRLEEDRLAEEKELREEEDRLREENEARETEKRIRNKRDRQITENEKLKVAAEKKEKEDEEEKHLAAAAQEIKDEMMCTCLMALMSPHRSGKCVGRKILLGTAAVAVGGVLVAAIAVGANDTDEGKKEEKVDVEKFWDEAVCVE